MARRRREFSATTQFLTVAVGASDTTTITITAGALIPHDGARIDKVWATTGTAGVGSGGTFTIQLLDGATALTAAGITVDADAAAGTVHGSMEGNGTQAATGGGPLGIATVKTGTVSTGAILQICILWQM